MGSIRESLLTLEPTPTADGGDPSVGGDLLRRPSCQRGRHNARMKNSGHSMHSIRSADPQDCLVLAGLRPFAELEAAGPLQRAAESDIDSALQLAVLCRTVAIF